MLKIAELGQAIGVPEIAGLSRRELVSDFFHAAVAGLSDGDLLIQHSEYSGHKAELYGHTLYNDGRIAKQLARTAIENGPAPSVVYDFQSFAAEVFVNSFGLYNTQTHSAVSIWPDQLVVHDRPYPLSHMPKLVIDMGACLSSRSLIHDQIELINRKVSPFVFAPLFRQHFTNQVHIQTYAKLLDKDIARLVLDNRLYIGREDGVDAATAAIIDAQTVYGASTAVADVILCTGAQHSTPKDIRSGIERAHTLLVEGGSLVIKAFNRPGVDELGADQIAAWAFNSGFEERHSQSFLTGISSIGILLSSGHFGEREMKTFVMQK